MTKKTLEEQLSEMQKKKIALEARIKSTKAKAKEAERKARTHRLIEEGAIIEKAMAPLNEEERQRLLEFLTKENPSKPESQNTLGKYILGKIREQKSTGSL